MKFIRRVIQLKKGTGQFAYLNQPHLILMGDALDNYIHNIGK